MATVICMLNFKGGVGKTTATVNLAAALSRLKKKVLVVDLDVQCTATKTYNKTSPYDGHTIYEILTGKNSEAVTYETKDKNIDYMPSSSDMRYVEMELNRKREREHILSKYIKVVEDSYDFIILDCPPGKGIITDNAMVAAQKVIIPVKCEVYSMYGLSDIINEINDVHETCNDQLEMLGILANEYDGRTIINREIIESLREQFPGKVFETKIRKNVALSEFSSQCENVFDYNTHCNGAEDFSDLAKEVIKKCK